MRRTFALGAFLALGAIAASCGDDAAVDPPADAGSETSTEAGPDTGPVNATYGLDSRPANPTCKAPARPPSTAPVKYERVFQNVNLGGEIMGMLQKPGDKSKWYVAQRGGTIVRFDVAAAAATPDAGPPLEPTLVADVGALAGVPVMNYVEAGLLGFAFHPKFATNGRLYVSWVSEEIKSVIGYLTSTDGGNTFTSYTKVLDFDRYAFSHCGGTVAFGPDGFLYASFGDGGVNNDYYTFGQSLDGFQSKILRIDVDTPPPAGQTYVIPDGNPFKNGGGEPATFARGFRNPYRFSFDRVTGDLWVGDVGEGSYEELDKVVAGANYGWSCREGMHNHDNFIDPVRCPSKTGLTDPVYELKHLTPYSRALVYGHVYRGNAIPSLVGSHVFADFVNEELYTLSFDPGTGDPKATIVNPSGPAGFYWNGFAEDLDGETYVYGDAVHKLVAAGPPAASTFPDRLSKTGCVDPSDAKKPASGLVPYTVNAPFWSDGADKQRFLALPDTGKITVKDDGDFDFPNGTVLVKNFSIGGKRIETRLFMRHDDGIWSGYSYEWNDEQTDAILLPAGKKKSVGTQSWIYPSRSDCLRCHNEGAGRTLGLELGQLDGDLVYPTTNRVANQLATLEHIGMLDKPLPPARTAIPDPLGTAPLDTRARAWLHTNCAGCHRPASRGDLDLRFGTALKDTRTCNVDPQNGTLGVAGAKLLVPGAPEKSLLSLRPHAPVIGRMPPLASDVVDAKGTALIDEWIRSIASCP